MQKGWGRLEDNWEDNPSLPLVRSHFGSRGSRTARNNKAFEMHMHPSMASLSDSEETLRPGGHSQQSDMDSVLDSVPMTPPRNPMTPPRNSATTTTSAISTPPLSVSAEPASASSRLGYDFSRALTRVARPDDVQARHRRFIEPDMDVWDFRAQAEDKAKDMWDLGSVASAWTRQMDERITPATLTDDIQSFCDATGMLASVWRDADPDNLDTRRDVYIERMGEMYETQLEQFGSLKEIAKMFFYKDSKTEESDAEDEGGEEEVVVPSQALVVAKRRRLYNKTSDPSFHSER